MNGAPLDAVEQYLSQLAAEERPAAVTLTIRQLVGRAKQHVVAAAILAYEAKVGEFYRVVRKPDGTAYASAKEYLADVLDTGERMAERWAAVGGLVQGLPPAERPVIEQAIGAVGISKAAIVVTALERVRSHQERLAWLERARTEPADQLQDSVNAAFQTGRRREATDDNDDSAERPSRFLASLLRHVPEDARAEVRLFFARGRRVARLEDTDPDLKDVAVLLFALRQCAREWGLVEAQLREGAS